MPTLAYTLGTCFMFLTQESRKSCSWGWLGCSKMGQGHRLSPLSLPHGFQCVGFHSTFVASWWQDGHHGARHHFHTASKAGSRGAGYRPHCRIPLTSCWPSLVTCPSLQPGHWQRGEELSDRAGPAMLHPVGCGATAPLGFWRQPGRGGDCQGAKEQRCHKLLILGGGPASAWSEATSHTSHRSNE